MLDDNWVPFPEDLFSIFLKLTTSKTEIPPLSWQVMISVTLKSLFQVFYTMNTTYQWVLSQDICPRQ